MKSVDKIKMTILAAMLAKDSLELLTMNEISLCRMQFHQIALSMKALDDHLKEVS